MGNGWLGDEENDISTYAAAAREGQLELDHQEENLPWLDSDEELEESGVDNGRVIIIALAGLLVILGGLAVFWYLGRGGSGAADQADGSTIAAPAGPYKERPLDPGGKTFEGTGDASFAVAEGMSPEARLAPSEPARPSIDLKQEPDAPAPAPATAAVSAPAGGPVVQVGAYLDRAAANVGWATLQNQYSVLKGTSHRIVEGKADIGTVFRLQVIAQDRASAVSLCNALKAQGGACQVK